MTEDKTAEFFIELLSEEMPARMQMDAEKQPVTIPEDLRTESRGEEIPKAAEKRIKDDISAKLHASGLLDSADAVAQSWSTPRRLAVCIPDVRVIEPAREEEKRGPRADAPAEAINGFLRSAGITKEDAEIRQTSKGEFYFAVQKHKGRKAADILPILIAEVIADFKWPKAMRWGEGQKRWVRPLRGIVALFDGKALKGEVDFGGDEKIYLGDQTRGHRFLADNQLITITSGADYEEIMKEHFVIVSKDKRKDMIAEQIEGQNKGNKSLGIVNTKLLREVMGLVEYPNAIQVKIDEEFMTLPERIRITAMESHQKFLHLHDNRTSEYLPNFVAVADSAPDKERDERIRAGAERVMRARLADLRFSLEEDEKTGLDTMRKRLDGMAFFDGLGTMGDKTERLIKLTQDYADSYEVDKGEIEKAARYAKADLASNTVNELPSLQGFMGGHLAREKYSDTVANAISDHYHHEFGFFKDAGQQYHLRDRLKHYLGLMDRIDTLIAFVAIGKMPTGSKDPYALRRAGSSIVGIILNVRDSVSLGEIFYKALNYLEEDGVSLSKPREELYNDFISFLHDRAENTVAAHRTSRIPLNAVFHRDTKDKENIKYLSHLAFNFNDFIKKTESIDFIAAYKRLANILDAEDKKDASQWGNPEVDLFDHSAEYDLHKSIKKAQVAIYDARNQSDRIDTEIKALKKLTEPINDFLDAVRVNDEDPKIRKNRLNLLNRARTEIKKVADFDKIQ